MLTLNLTPAEFQALAGLIDAGVRQVGIRAITPEALSILGKLQAAADEMAKPAAEPVEPEAA